MKRLLVVVFAGLCLLAGCGGGKPAISVSASSSASTVEAGQTAQITATLANDSSNQGVSWTVSCSTAPCGSVSPTSSTTSPFTTTYTAPGSAPSSNLTVTITATSVKDPSKSTTVTITVPAIAVSVSPSTPQTVDYNSSAQVTATVANDPSSGGVNWTLTQAGTSCSPTCGTVSPGSTASGTATTYTAPTTPPSSDLVVTLTATSATDNTKSASVTITVPAVTVSVTPSAKTVQAGQTQGFSATVNNTSNTGVTWTLYQGLTPCSPTCGTLSSSTTNPVTYTAPSTPPSSDLTVTLTAVSSADVTKSASATITVPAITVSVSPSTTQTVEATQTQQFSATVNNTSNTGVTWTLHQGLTPCSPTCGTLSSSTTNPVTYTAPSTPPSTDLTVTLTAVSSADNTKSASVTITVPAITVSVTPSAPQVVINGTQNFTATISNDPTTAGVNWTLTWNGSPCTTASTCGALSGQTATAVTYTAPATVPSPATVTVTATSVTDTSKTASATITVTTSFIAACNGSGSESLLNGHYAFLLKGFDSTPQPVLVGGVITVDGSGNVTTGTMDMNLSGGVQTGLNVTAGSYSIGSDHRGCMTLTTSAGTQDYRFSLGGISGGVASTGHMIDFDSAGPFTTGVLLQQTTTAFSTASVTGNYAFGVSSAQNSTVTLNGVVGGKFAVAGVFNLAAGVVSGGELDVNGNGQLDGNSSLTSWPSSPISVNAGGTYTVDATSGRGTLTFTPSVASSAVNSVIYVVSSNEFLALSSDDQTANAIFAGTALKQSGSFSNSSLNGTSVLYASQLSGSSSGTTRTTLGLIASTGSSATFTFSGYQNDGGSFSTESASGSFSVASTGRVLLSNAGNQSPLFYLVTSNEAFFLGADGGVQSGFFEPQTGSSFTAASLNGTFAFGTINPEQPGVDDSSGVAAFDGTSTITGTSDDNSSGSLNANGAISGTYSVDSNGLVHNPSSCTVSASSTTCDGIFLIISPTKAVRMDTKSSNTNPAVQTAGQ
ncbi:MAG TPA: hypothetical protein VNJ12_12385 [Candidatus Dormibacteraeota bacterium]|nr:hypothetical protein [Candidatus Dormibacteraeota bacterium]